MTLKSVITGTGSYIPSVKKHNKAFINETFLNEDGTPFENENDVIIDKFQAITGIEERRYAKPEEDSSDLGFFASEKAIKDAGVNPEELDYIIVAHNFGDIKSGTIQSDMLPSLASRIKFKLGIANPNCVAYDILFGCPGWVQGVIQAEAFIKAGIAKKCLIIGTETLSRVVDKYDRDSMIFADGAGACVIEAEEGDANTGILSHATRTDVLDECYYLHWGKSFKEGSDPTVGYIKMLGRKIYEYSLTNVPLAMKAALDKSGVEISDVKKVFIHQANEKMDEQIIRRFYRLYKEKVPEGVMPMSIHKLGNSSVATVPTLFDMVKHGEMENQEINSGDVVIFASVGAGMNINAVVYRY